MGEHHDLDCAHGALDQPLDLQVVNRADLMLVVEIRYRGLIANQDESLSVQRELSDHRSRIVNFGPYIDRIAPAILPHQVVARADRLFPAPLQERLSRAGNLQCEKPPHPSVGYPCCWRSLSCQLDRLPIIIITGEFAISALPR